MDVKSYFTIHNHTEFSIKDGFGHVEEMLDRAKELGLNGIAFTEHGNVMSAPYACKQKENYKELKIVYGVEFYECFDINVQDKDNKYFHLIALAKNEKGRVAINTLITKSEFYGKYFKPRIDLNIVKELNCGNDLIVSSACLASKLAREKDYEKCIEYVNEYKNIFPHFYLEMQSHSNIEQQEYNKKILKLSKDTNTPFVITTDSHAPTKDMLEFQGRHVQISQDKETMSESYEGCYIQSVEEIHETMDEQIGYDNVEKGLKETNNILELIEEVNVPFQDPKLPTFPLPNYIKSNSEYVRKICERGWYERGFDKLNVFEQQKRRERLEYETGIIDKMGFNGYFLIVWDAINWGNENGVEFGRGRGSGAGSIVCYLMHITDVDPIEHGLIFERFLNPERVGLPDIDTDTSPKEKVINHFKDKYGEMNVCQVMAFSYITPLMAIKDCARVLDRDEDRIKKGWKIGASIANEIAKYFTEKTFEKCIESSWEDIPKKYKTEQFDDLYRIAKMLSGRIRQVSTHAGGVGIVDTNINNYMPMMLSAKGEHVIQCDKHYVEDIGIVKFDFLGLGTLDIIKEARERAGLTKWDLDPNNKDFVNDKESYELLARGETNGVFQVESQGMKDLLVRMKPSCLNDVSAVLALYRPDTMGVLDDYIAVKNGEKEPTYIHEDMKPIFKETYGQCIEKGQFVTTDKGNVKIENINIGDYVDTTDGFKIVTDFKNNGIKSIYEVTLSNGKKVCATNNHKLLTQRGWVEIKDLQDNDTVAYKVNVKNTNKYNKDKLKIMGYLLGDGYMNASCVKFYNSDINIVKDFINKISTTYDDLYVKSKLREVKSGSLVYECTVNSKTPYSRQYEFNKDLKDFCLRYGNSNGCLAQEKHIPNFVFSLNKDCILELLGGILDTDGCYTSRGHIRFKTSSKKLAYDIQELIRIIGYSSTITETYGKYYDVVVSKGNKLAKEFINHSIKINYLYENITDKPSLVNVISSDYVKKYVIDGLNKNKISGRKAYNLTGVSFVRNLNKISKYVPVESIIKLKNICDFPKEWLNEDLIWCKIKSIKNTNRKSEVFDITVDDVHNFTVDGIVVHNCVYQEQMMEVVKVIGGRSYGGADKFRKGIGKKDIELVKKESNKLYQEIIDNGYSENVAKQISDEMSQKGGYAFNKSHSVAYAVNTLTTAYLKVHYPSSFYCAELNKVSSDGGKVNKYILDAQNFGVEIVKPHINRSESKFSIFNDKIIFGLSCINGIGESLVEKIIEERELNGKFTGLEDLLSRVKLNKSQVVALIKSGAIPTKDKAKTIKEYAMSIIKNDNTYPEYKPVKSLPSLIELKTKWNIDTDIIKDKEERLKLYNNARKIEHETIKKIEWEEKQKKTIENIKNEFKEKYLKDEQFWEFEALSIFLNNNPFKDLQKYITQDFYDVEEDMECIIVGVISSIQKKKDRNKKDYAYVRVYESNGLLEGIAWNSVYSKYLPLIKKGNKLAFYGQKNGDETFIIKKIKTIEEWIDDRQLNNEVRL